MKGPILALAGGVGGAKLAWGLSQLLSGEQLTIVVNTADDETFHGLHVSPDLDTIMYTLAGIANPETGWGIEGDTFQALHALEQYGVPAWFQLGDRDLATHIRRTELLRQGSTLSQVTQELCRRLGVPCEVVPMSDDPVRTVVETNEGTMPFQDYFVRRRCEPFLRRYHFDGVETAAPSPRFQAALEKASGLVFCPSNPFVSLGPILALNGVRERITAFQGRRVAVSPLVGGEALRGPAAKMFREMGEDPSALAVARRMVGLCDIFVLDQVDSSLADLIRGLELEPVVAPTVMVTPADKIRLAQTVYSLIER